MCIIYLAFNQHPDLPLILLANRDEFYERPTAAAAYWTDFPNVYGGRDLRGGGTWLGVTNSGRFGAVTNYRDPAAPTGFRSRGNLVADFLRSEQRAMEYLAEIKTRASDYSGFNLLVGEIAKKQEVFYFSNRGTGIEQLSPGLYGLSNHLLDTPWPKVEKGKGRFAKLLRDTDPSNETFFELLSDRCVALDKELPATGVPFEVERALSAIFIQTPDYGTRCSTVLRFNGNSEWNFEERVFV